MKTLLLIYAFLMIHLYYYSKQCTDMTYMIEHTEDERVWRSMSPKLAVVCSQSGVYSDLVYMINVFFIGSYIYHRFF